MKLTRLIEHLQKILTENKEDATEIEVDMIVESKDEKNELICQYEATVDDIAYSSRQKRVKLLPTDF